MVGNYSVVYCIKNLDDMYEVGSLQTMNQFMDANSFVDTGFRLFTSANKYNSTGEITERLENNIETNARSDLFFSRQVETEIKTRFGVQFEGNVSIKLSGYVSTTYSQLDLQQLLNIMDSFRIS